MKKISPVIYRYSRYVDEEQGRISAKGGVVYAFQIDFEKEKVKVGLAICSEKENFNKKIGRSLALERLKSDPIEFDYDVLFEGEGLVEMFWRNCKDGCLTLSPKNKRLIKEVKFNKLEY